MDLRALDKADFPDVIRYLALDRLEGLSGLAGDRGLRMSVSDIEDGLEKWRTDETGFTRLIEVDGEVAGHVRSGWWWDAMAPWIDVVVDPDRRHRGLGTAAARSVLMYLFGNTPAHVVHASTPDWNEDGVRFAERLGFERAGVRRRTGIRNGRYVHSVEFELLRDRWEQSDAVDR